MKQIKVAGQMIDLFETGFNASLDILDIHGVEQTNAKNVQKVYENPDELGYRVRT